MVDQKRLLHPEDICCETLGHKYPHTRWPCGRCKWSTYAERFRAQAVTLNALAKGRANQPPLTSWKGKQQAASGRFCSPKFQISMPSPVSQRLVNRRPTSVRRGVRQALPTVSAGAFAKTHLGAAAPARPTSMAWPREGDTYTQTPTHTSRGLRLESSTIT